MNDEAYMFVSDSREKKNIARSSHNKRTHTGKGGKVRFPSDNLTKKELAAMSSEVKSYRLNEPMKWAEFKSMPDDIKRDYITLIRQKFNTPAKMIAKMLGISSCTLSHEIGRLGISEGKHSRGRCTPWDKSGFNAWAFGEAENTDPAEEPSKEHENGTEEFVDEPEEIAEPVPVPVPVPEANAAPVEKRKVIPGCGTLMFDGKYEDALDTLRNLLGSTAGRITVTWENNMQFSGGDCR